jgi:large subunit ribosomal protein L30
MRWQIGAVKPVKRWAIPFLKEKKMKIKVVQRKSVIGRPQRQRETMRGLGLTKIGKVKILNDTPAIRGMINKVSHLVEWEAING